MGAAGASPYVLALRDELRSKRMKTVGRLTFGDREIELTLGSDSLWAITRRGAARLAIRTAYAPGGLSVEKAKPKRGEAARFVLRSAIGRHVVTIGCHDDGLSLLRITVKLTPTENLLIPHLPRDLYPLDANDDPLAAEGEVLAAQRGMNGGLLFWRLDGETPGSLLYLQNLTALNPYFNATGTKPDGAVGGEWPELGYLPPTPPQSGTPPVNPLPKGEEIALSDALIVFHEDAPRDEAHSAALFLQMIGCAYRLVDKPHREFHDWVERAERTAHDLDTAPSATIRHYGHTYVHPYTAAEYPDSMVQLITLSSLHAYGRWRGSPTPMEAKLATGLGRFFDKKLGTMRRYLPNVGNDKDANAVDSWYLYHPLLSLGQLALDGDANARRLFENSLEYAIKAARHFRYKWPIQYNVQDFSVITKARDDQGLGQTDVGGIYAYLMLVAFELTDDARFLGEARQAIDAAVGMRFELNYQANLTAWGAAACMRLWRIANDQKYLAQTYVYLASFFHNSVLWESDIGAAARYRTFLGVTALHDGPYMALYECFDSFAAFERLLKDSGAEFDPAVRVLVIDYCRFALDRAWYYYPDALPKALLCGEPRNGHIDAKLSFPVEDLYVGGDIAGQVGQEIYGAGAAFTFVSRMLHDFEGAPFRLFSDHFVVTITRVGERAVTLQLAGCSDTIARLSFIPTDRIAIHGLAVRTDPGGDVPLRRAGQRIDADLLSGAIIQIRW